MAAGPTKRASRSNDDASLSDSASAREEEKTIPFLRRLTDMLLENEDVISFIPGHTQNSQVVLGRIVVHDRVKVEADVLPRYFNHSSFASLRRQLNYFSFTRVGKGRQRGATYCNEGVIELEDILQLKRRSVTNNSMRDSSSSPSGAEPAPILPKEAVPELCSDDSDVAPKQNKRARTSSPDKSDGAFLVSDEETAPGRRISLDLTTAVLTPFAATHDGFVMDHGEDDVLAGCRALLSFSRGFHPTDGIALS